MVILFFFAGAFIGFWLAAMCQVASDADDRMGIDDNV